MTPDQVPDEWIDTVIRAAADFTHADMCGCEGWPSNCFDSLTIGQLETDNEREVIAAAYPLIAAKVRAELAADLFERADSAAPQTGFRRGLRAAAQIVNPPTIEDAAKALQAMYEQDIARAEHCTQCGKAFTEAACGPTHAIIASERARISRGEGE